ncbi:hypothetical protein, partial [Sphingobium sp. R-7]|uniref:hypothetical protein n=1 Tax=Sphingobium sp. R-7 TaxID=3375449 RepID=UPI00398AC60D
LEAGCFAHARRKFFELADVEGAARKKSRGKKAPIVYRGLSSNGTENLHKAARLKAAGHSGRARSGG